ncbi:hypothetical protein Tco_1269813 [Tanacetum coccineum]
MGDTIARTRFESVSKSSNDSLLAGVNTPRSDKDRLKLNELMEFCMKDLENTKTAQAQEITSLKLRFKKLEKKGGLRTYGLKRLYKVGLSRRVESSDEEGLGKEDASKQGRITNIDVDAGINMVSTHFDANIDMFRVHDLDGNEVLEKPKVTIKDVNLSVNEVTLAQALAALKSAKVQEKANVVEKPSESITTTPTLTTTTATTITTVKAQDKGKGIMVEEPVKMKKKDQISLDEELAFKLQAEEEEEEERLAREKAQREEEANIVSWDNVQAMIDADYQMAQQMQAEEQEKNNQLKNKSFDDIQKLFDKAMKKVNTSVDMDIELVEGSEVRVEVKIAQESSSKRAYTKLEQESIKKQKVDEDKETVELQRLIDAIPWATKPPSIVD